MNRLLHSSLDSQKDVYNVTIAVNNCCHCNIMKPAKKDNFPPGNESEKIVKHGGWGKVQELPFSS